MRILKVSQTYYPYLNEGGRPVKVRSLAEHLAGRGHAVTVLTADLGPRTLKGKEGTEGSNATEGSNGVRKIRSEARPRAVDAPEDGCWEQFSESEIRNPKSEIRNSPLSVIYLPTVARYRTLTVNPGVVPFCLQRLREFDTVHIYGLYDLLGPVVAGFCRRWGMPYVVEPMGMYRPIVRSLRKKRLYHRLLGRTMIEGAARVIATSEQERQELIEEGLPPEKMVVRRNGLDLSEFERLPPRGAFRRELGLPPDEPLVLYLGRLSRKKGLDLLLRAFAGLSVPARLAVVGPDDRDGCVEELERLRAELGLGERVVLAGPRFGAPKLQAFADADLFVLPSRNENFGNAAAEAVACGVPVVVTDQCGIAPFIRDRVGVVVEVGEWRMENGRWRMEGGIREKGNKGKREKGERGKGEKGTRGDGEEVVGGLREALGRLLSDHELRERFRANTVQVPRELSWEEPVREQEQIYESVVKCAASPVS